MKSFSSLVFRIVLSAALMLSPCVFADDDDNDNDNDNDVDDSGGLVTLRGAPITSTSEAADALKKPMETDPLERDFTQQPPLVTHTVDNYQITKSFNKCLDCHSWETYRERKATKIPQTHFQDAEGKVLASAAPRRYFCLQCHVPQVDAKPLVDNTYERATSR